MASGSEEFNRARRSIKDDLYDSGQNQADTLSLQASDARRKLQMLNDMYAGKAASKLGVYQGLTGGFMQGQQRAEEHQRAQDTHGSAQQQAYARDLQNKRAAAEEAWANEDYAGKNPDYQGLSNREAMAAAGQRSALGAPGREEAEEKRKEAEHPVKLAAEQAGIGATKAATAASNVQTSQALKSSEVMSLQSTLAGIFGGGRANDPDAVAQAKEAAKGFKGKHLSDAEVEGQLKLAQSGAASGWNMAQIQSAAAEAVTPGYQDMADKMDKHGSDIAHFRDAMHKFQAYKSMTFGTEEAGKTKDLIVADLRAAGLNAQAEQVDAWHIGSNEAAIDDALAKGYDTLKGGLKNDVTSLGDPNTQAGKFSRHQKVAGTINQLRGLGQELKANGADIKDAGLTSPPAQPGTPGYDPSDPNGAFRFIGLKNSALGAPRNNKGIFTPPPPAPQGQVTPAAGATPGGAPPPQQTPQGPAYGDMRDVEEEDQTPASGTPAR